MKKILIPILLFLLIFSIVVMGAPSYVNIGPTTEFTGDVGVPAGSGYYIGDVKLEIDELVEGWTFTHLEDQLFFGELAGTHFLDLLDTPISYTGEAGKYLRANAGETALEFATPAGAGTVTTSGAPAVNDIARFTGATVIEGRSYAEFKADLDLEIGTDIQALDAALTSISGLVYVSPSLIKLTANDTYTVRTLAEVRTDLGLVIGTNVQAYDAGLTSLAGLTYASDSFVKVTATDVYAIRTITETKTDLSLNYVENLKVKLDGTAAPAAATDDVTLGYTVGSRWFDITNDKEYVCLDNTDGAAVWTETTGAAGGYTNLTSFVDQTAWRLFYSNTDGDVVELAFGAAGTYLKSNGAAAAPTFTVPGGAGDVVKVGTPADSQIGVWTGDGTIEGAASLTYDGANLQLTGDIGSTGTKITKGWFTDMTVANAIAGDITGNAATVTSFTPASGSLTLAGADALTLTTTAATDVTLPTSGIVVSDASACTNLEGTLLSIATGTLNATIPADHITYDMMQDITDTDKILGRSTAGAGTVEEISCTSAGRALIDDADASAQRTTLGLVIGTNVLAEQTIGIGDDNLLEVDDADAADNDFAKFTANGLEGRSYSETMEDLNPVTTVTAAHTMTIAEAGTVLVSCAATPYTITLPTAVGHSGLRYHFIKTDANYFLITLDGNAAETLNYENSTGTPNTTYGRLNTYCAEVTVISDNSNWQVINEAMGQVPTAKVYLDGDFTAIKNATFTVIGLNAEVFDIGDNFDLSTWVSGNATSTSANHLVDSGGAFTSDMAGYRVKNTTDITYAYITTVNSATDVTLSADIFVDTEGYEIKHAIYIIPVPGKYEFSGFCNYDSTNMLANKRFYAQITTATTSLEVANLHSAVASKELGLPLANTVATFAIDDEIYMRAYHEAGTNTIVVDGDYGSTWMYIKLISKD